MTKKKSFADDGWAIWIAGEDTSTFYLNEYAKEMRIGGMYDAMLQDLRETFGEYRRVLKKYGTRQAIYGYIQRVGLEVVTILGATLYAVWSAMCLGSENGGMQVGDCIVVLGSIGTISYCLNNLVQNFAEFGEHALFLDDVRYFLDYQPTVTDGALPAPAEGGEMEVRNLSFRYEGSDRDTLHDVNFVWRKGERIALVGSNGSGKTTLVKLLLRLYDPREGEILVNGQNIKSFSQSSYRECFSTVFQDFKMFSMSVKDNVLLRLPKEGDEELVTHALQESGVISGGMIPKIDCCIEAINEGVKNVVIMDGRVPHSSLMEILTDEGAGTMVMKERR